MTLTRLDKFPAPWFGGKADAAPVIWAALGDVAHYAEPFSGSLAVLLRRPHECNRAYYSETVNDVDGLLVNALRSIQLHPDATAEAASWYVAEADLMARHLAILKWRNERELERLMADPAYCDPVIGGWWLWGLSCWIGRGWCSGTGPWIVGADGRITRNKGGGVWRQLPHLGNNGQGVNNAGAREPGVAGQPPTPESEWGALVERDYAETGGYHPMTMPEVRRWFDFLRARLRHVRILNGDWRRLVTGGALKTLTVRQGNDVAGIFLDPPYKQNERDDGLYNSDAADKVQGRDLAGECREWCLANGADPDYRIILAGYAGEGHEVLEEHGWRVVEWFKGGFLKGGMAQQGENGHQQHRERLWLSPGCLDVTAVDEPAEAQLGLWPE